MNLMKQVNIIPINTIFFITVAGNSIKCKHGENKHGGAKLKLECIGICMEKVIDAFEQET